MIEVISTIIRQIIPNIRWIEILCSFRYRHLLIRVSIVKLNVDLNKINYCNCFPIYLPFFDMYHIAIATITIAIAAPFFVC
jgi:hypothetical protein